MIRKSIPMRVTLPDEVQGCIFQRMCTRDLAQVAATDRILSLCTRPLVRVRRVHARLCIGTYLARMVATFRHDRSLRNSSAWHSEMQMMMDMDLPDFEDMMAEAV